MLASFMYEVCDYVCICVCVCLCVCVSMYVHCGMSKLHAASLLFTYLLYVLFHHTYLRIHI